MQLETEKSVSPAQLRIYGSLTSAKVIGNASLLTRFGELFTVPRIRNATLAAATLHVGQDLCGINSALCLFSVVTRLTLTSSYRSVKCRWMDSNSLLLQPSIARPSLSTVVPALLMPCMPHWGLVRSFSPRPTSFMAFFSGALNFVFTW